MPICQKCGVDFENRVTVGGKRRNIGNRRYCLKCSPFGCHNTRKINGQPRKDQHPYKCKCGETNPSKFYGLKRTVCSICHNRNVIRLAREKRKRAIDQLGGKCCICGYRKYYGSIDLHHIDPSKKDVNFASLRGWSWKRLAKEITKCLPLCRNCHGEVHAGITKIGA